MTDKELEIIIRARDQATAELRKLRAELRAVGQEAARVGKAMNGNSPNGKTPASVLTAQLRQQTEQIRSEGRKQVAETQAVGKLLDTEAKNFAKKQQMILGDNLKQQSELREQARRQQESIEKDFNKRFIDAQKRDLKTQADTQKALDKALNEAARKAARERAAIEKAESGARISAITADTQRAVGAIEAGAQAEMAARRQSAAGSADLARAEGAERVRVIQEQSAQSLRAIQDGSHALLGATEASTRAQLGATLDGIRQQADLDRALVKERIANFRGGLAEEMAMRQSALGEIQAIERSAARQQIEAINSLTNARIAEINRSTKAEIAALESVSRQRLGIEKAAMEAQLQSLMGLRRQDQENIKAKYAEDLAAMRAHYAQMGSEGAAAIGEQAARLQAARDIDLANSRKNYDLEAESIRNAFTERRAVIESGLAAEVAAREAAAREAVALQNTVGNQLIDSTRRAAERQAIETRRVFTDQVSTILDASYKWEQVSQSLFMAGATLSAAITAPVVLGTKAVIGFGSSFEDSMAGVAKTSFDASLSMEQNAAAVDELGKRFVQMSTVMPATREEIARVGEIAGQLGISGVDNIAKFTDTIIRMAESSNMTAEEAADGMARLANVLTLPTTEIDNLGNTIAGLGITMAATESEILNMSFRIAGAGKQAGFTDAEILALAASLASVGVKAEMGGSAISRVIKDITRWVALGGSELQSLADIAGMSAQQFADAWRENPADALLIFLEALNRVGEEGAGNLQFLDDVGLDGIRVSDILLRMSGNTDLVADALRRSNPLWEQNSELVRISNNRFQTLSAQWQMAKNEISAVALALYDRLRPALIAIVRGLAGMGDMLVGVVGVIADLPTPILVLVAALAAAVAAIGPLMIAGAGLGAVMAGLSSLAATLATTFGIFAGLTAGPLALGIIAATGGVAALAAAIALVIIYWDDLSGLMPNTIGLLSQVGEIIAAIIPSLTTIGSLFVFAFEMALGPIALAIIAVDSLIGSLDDLVGWLGGVAKAAPGAFMDLIGWADKATGGLVGFLGGAVLGAVPGAKQVTQIATAVKDVAESLDYEKKSADDAAKSYEGLTDAQAAYVALQDDAIVQTRAYQDELARQLELHKDEIANSKTRGDAIVAAGLAAASAAREQMGLNATYDDGNIAVAAYFAKQEELRQALGRGFQQKGRYIAQLKHEGAEVESLQRQYEQFAEMVRNAFVGSSLEELPALIDAGLKAVTIGAADMRDFTKMLQSTGLASEQVIESLIAKRRELQLSIVGLNPDIAEEAAQIKAGTAMLARYDEAIRRAAEGAYGFASAIANADTVNMGFDAAKAGLQEQVGYWENLKSEAEKGLEVLTRFKEEQGGILTPEQQAQWENLTWLVGRSAGAIEDDLEPAMVNITNAHAEWIKKLDELNARRADIGDEEYNRQLVELSKNFNGALDPAGNLTTGLTLLTDAINNLKNAILGLPQENPLPPEINTKVNLNTADWDRNMTVTRDEAQDFADTPISATVGANIEPSAQAYATATAHWQEFANSNPMTTASVDIRDAVANFIIIMGQVKAFRESAPVTPAQLDNVPFMGTMAEVFRRIDEYIASEPSTTLHLIDGATSIIDTVEGRLAVLTGQTWSVRVQAITEFGPGEFAPPTSSGGGGGSSAPPSGIGPSAQRRLSSIPQNLMGGASLQELVSQRDVQAVEAQAMNAQSYVDFVRETVSLLADAAASMGDADEAAKSFADNGKAAFEALLAAWEFLDTVGGETVVFADQHRANMEALNDLLYKIVKLMAQNAESINGDYLENGKLFAEGAQAGAAAFTAGLEFLTVLDESALELTEEHHRTLEAVNDLLYKIVRLVAQNAESLNGPGLEAAKTFSEAASSMVSLMSTALDFFIKLHEATEDGVEIITDIASVVVVLSSRSRLIVDALLAVAPVWEEEIPTQLQRYADGVSAAVNTMTAVLDFYTRLQEAVEAEVDYAGEINSVVVVLTARSRTIADAFKAVVPEWASDEGVAGQMAGFAQAVSDATGGLTSVLDLLTRLLEVTTELDYTHDEVRQIAVHLSEQGRIIAEAFRAVVPAWASDEGATGAIGDFSNAVADANAALNDTLEFLGRITETAYAMSLSEEEVFAVATHLSRMAFQIATAFGIASDTWKSETHPNIEAFAQDAGASLDLIVKAADAMSAIMEFGAPGTIASMATKLDLMVGFVNTVLEKVQFVSDLWNIDVVEALADFADGAGRAIALVGAVAEAMEAVVGISRISKRHVEVFVANFQVMLDLVRQLNTMAQGYLAEAKSFQQIAEAIAAALNAAADAMRSITGEADPRDTGGDGGGRSSGATGAEREGRDFSAMQELIRTAVESLGRELDDTFADNITTLLEALAEIRNVPPDILATLNAALGDELEKLGLSDAESIGETILKGMGFTASDLASLGLSSEQIKALQESLGNDFLKGQEDLGEVVTRETREQTGQMMRGFGSVVAAVKGIKIPQTTTVLPPGGGGGSGDGPNPGDQGKGGGPGGGSTINAPGRGGSGAGPAPQFNVTNNITLDGEKIASKTETKVSQKMAQKIGRSL